MSISLASRAFTRVDQQVDFDWNAASPGEGLKASAFGVRWTGTITVPKPGDYPFSFTLAHCYPCDDAERVSVFLDGKRSRIMWLSQSEFRANGLKPFTLSFADTQPHRVTY